VCSPCHRGKADLAGSFKLGLARPNQELFCLNSHGGAEPPCSGRLAVPVFISADLFLFDNIFYIQRNCLLNNAAFIFMKALYVGHS
jgi:hypothetical protein